jgi:hypothetical protein
MRHCDTAGAGSVQRVGFGVRAGMRATLRVRQISAAVRMP